MTPLKRLLPVIFAALCALLLVLPFAKVGVPSGHDFDFHVSGWYDAAWQWHQGVLYPRIARWSDYGAGEPRFVFYPPLSWMWGALLTHVISPKFVMALYVVTVFAFGGCGAWLLARRWFGERVAWWATACFVVNPYSAILVYFRSACAEMLGMALLPWLLLAWGEVERHWWILSVAFAAVWLANTPSALLVSYLLATLILVECVTHKGVRPLLRFGSLALGLALTAFYLVPALYEQRWLDLTQVLEPQLSPRYNVLFTKLGDPEFREYNHLVSWIALALLCACIAGAVANFKRLPHHPRLLLATASAFGILLLAPASVLLWEHLPKLRFVQFPWRYSFVLAVVSSLLIASSRPLLRVIVLALVWIPAALAMKHTTAPLYWTGDDDATEFRDNIAAQKGYEGIWDYAPANTSIDTIGEEDPEVAFRAGSGRALHETVFDREFEVKARKPGPVRIEVLDYPAWHIALDGTPVPNAHDDSGRILVRIPAGLHRITAHWQEPAAPRIAGAAISACALLISLGAHVIRRRQLNSPNAVPQ